MISTPTLLWSLVAKFRGGTVVRLSGGGRSPDSFANFPNGGIYGAGMARRIAD